MKIKTIRETRPAWEPPSERIQCQHTVNSHELYAHKDWRKERYKKLRPDFDPIRCQHLAVIEMDGIPMCRRHAGMVALDHMLKVHEAVKGVSFGPYVENVLSQGPAVTAKELARLQDKIVKAQQLAEPGSKMSALLRS